MAEKALGKGMAPPGQPEGRDSGEMGIFSRGILCLLRKAHTATRGRTEVLLQALPELLFTWKAHLSSLHKETYVFAQDYWLPGWQEWCEGFSRDGSLGVSAADVAGLNIS